MVEDTRTFTDAERLDFLDGFNARVNTRRVRPTGWGLEVNYARVTLVDCHLPAKNIREAIDAAIRADRPAVPLPPARLPSKYDCRGSFVLNTFCGECRRCDEEWERIVRAEDMRAAAMEADERHAALDRPES